MSYHNIEHQQGEQKEPIGDGVSSSSKSIRNLLIAGGLTACAIVAVTSSSSASIVMNVAKSSKILSLSQTSSDTVYSSLSDEEIAALFDDYKYTYVKEVRQPFLSPPLFTNSLNCMDETLIK